MLEQDDLEQEFDVEDEEIDELKLDGDNDPDDEPLEAEAKEPAPKMHISKEDWVAQGRDPDKWVSPEVFKETTRRINETSKLKQENARLRAERDEDNRRLTNVAFLQQQQITRLRADLEQKKDDAIEVGDKAAVKAFDRQLKDLETEESLIKPVPVQQQSIAPEIAEWNADNPWLTEDHPWQPALMKVLSDSIADGKTLSGALRKVDAEVARLKQGEPSAKRVASKSMVDSPSRSVGKSESVTLTLDQCTREEKDLYNEFYKPSGASLKDFLKDVSIARKGN